MTTKSVLSISNKTKTEPSQPRFSDYKVNTTSTAERHSASTISDSEISQFQPTGRNPQICSYQKPPPKTTIKTQLTFASVQYKRNLQTRLSNFLQQISSMLTHLSHKKSTRKSNLHNKILPAVSSNRNKLTFQMIGSYVKKDRFYVELCMQEGRLRQVKEEIEQLEEISGKVKGGFTEEEIIDLMNTVNRIQEYCQFLCQVLEELEGEFQKGE